MRDCAVTGSLGFTASTTDFFTMIPSNLSAPGVSGLPPAGTPNYYVQESLTVFNFKVRKFNVGPNCGGTGTLGAATNVSQAVYTGSGVGVPQPPPAAASNTLDPLIDRMMQKVQYRKVGSAESLWVVHTVQNTQCDGPSSMGADRRDGRNDCDHARSTADLCARCHPVSLDAQHRGR